MRIDNVLCAKILIAVEEHPDEGTGDFIRPSIDGYDAPILSYRELIRTYEAICATVKPAPPLSRASMCSHQPGAGRLPARPRSRRRST